MKEEYKDFIGIYDENVPVDLCNVFVENWEEGKKNQTIIDMTKQNETGYWKNSPPLVRKDEEDLGVIANVKNSLPMLDDGTVE